MRALKYNPPKQSLEIIYKDTHLLIVNKPAGLLSVPGKSDEHKDCLENRLKSKFANCLTIHRLDMATSGVMVFALTPKAQRHIGLQFERRQVKKNYIALISGCPDTDNGLIDMPLICDWPNRPKQKIDFENGKQAITKWKIIDKSQMFSRVLLKPKTGRSHQLRVHMQAIGHPILGDAIYADDQVYQMSDRLMLHSENISFRHPDGGRLISFTAPCPF